ncbi:uncharacterized protein LOC114343928 isoform X3 [Diabrotica virgifera virgifera]|uniref:Uncharacterized protein LOC114343928 isoform X3 n=1 Tax=Diabrotica virgifera virgifera TaxID=50390 RepID=A0A6P7GLP2_DIAVI|nr:uncharacterized protein LOC114343928 isoform X3 [Diabrotica virgifera virgifera]
MENQGHVKALCKKFESGEISADSKKRRHKFNGKLVTRSIETYKQLPDDKIDSKCRSSSTEEPSLIATKTSTEIEKRRKKILRKFDEGVANMKMDKFIKDDDTDVIDDDIGGEIDNIEYTSTNNNIEPTDGLQKNINKINKSDKDNNNILEDGNINLSVSPDLKKVELNKLANLNYSEELNYDHIYEYSPILIEEKLKFIFPDTNASSGSSLPNVATEVRQAIPRQSTRLTPEKRLHYIAKEIVETETTYCEELSKLVMLYKPYIEKNAPHDKKYLLKYLFGNIHDIYFKQVRFLTAIQDSRMDIDKILHSFIDEGTLFELYPPYFINRRKAEGVIKEFDHLLKGLHEYYNTSVEFTAYLLLPLNRLSKYVLFLKDILKQLKKLERPTEVCQIALDIVETQMRNGNDGIAIDSIKNCPLKRTDYGYFKQRERFNISNKYKKEAFVFLFENVVVFTTADPYELETFNYEGSINMKDLSMESVKDLTITLKDFEKCKNSKDPKEFTYILEAKNINIWSVWKRDLEIMLWEQLSDAKATTPTLSSSVSLIDINTLKTRLDKDKQEQPIDNFSCSDANSILSSPISKGEFGYFKAKAKFLLTKPVKQDVVVLLFENYVIITFEDATNTNFYHYYNSIKMTNLLMTYEDDNRIQLMDFAKSKEKVITSNYTYVIKALNKATWELWKKMLGSLLLDQFFQNRERHGTTDPTPTRSLSFSVKSQNSEEENQKISSPIPSLRSTKNENDRKLEDAEIYVNDSILPTSNTIIKALNSEFTRTLPNPRSVKGDKDKKLKEVASPLPNPRSRKDDNDRKLEEVTSPLPKPSTKDIKMDGGYMNLSPIPNIPSRSTKPQEIKSELGPSIPPLPRSRTVSEDNSSQTENQEKISINYMNLPPVPPRLLNDGAKTKEDIYMNQPQLPPRLKKDDVKIKEVSMNFMNLPPVPPRLIKDNEKASSILPLSIPRKSVKNNLDSREDQETEYGYLENIMPTPSRNVERKASLKELNDIHATYEMEEASSNTNITTPIVKKDLLTKENEFEISQLITNIPINNIDLGPFQKKQLFTILEPIKSEGILFLFKNLLIITTVDDISENVRYHSSIEVMNLNVTFPEENKICLKDFSEYSNLDKHSQTSCLLAVESSEIWKEWKSIFENVTQTRIESRTGTLRKPPLPLPRISSRTNSTDNGTEHQQSSEINPSSTGEIYSDLNGEDSSEDIYAVSDNEAVPPQLPPRLITLDDKKETPPLLPARVTQLASSKTAPAATKSEKDDVSNRPISLEMDFGILIQKSPIDMKFYGDFQMMEKFKIKKPFKMECVVFLFKSIIIFTFSEEVSSQSTFFINDNKHPQYCYYDCIFTKDVRVCCLDDHTLELTDFTKINETKNAAKYTFILESKKKGIIQKWNSAIEDILWYEWKVTKENAQKLIRSKTSVSSSGKKLKSSDLKNQIKTYTNEQIQSIKYSGLKKHDYGMFKMKSTFYIMEPIEAQGLVFLFDNVIVFTVRDEETPGSFHSIGYIKLDYLHVEDYETYLLVLSDTQKSKKKLDAVPTSYVLKAENLITWQTWKLHLRKILS